MKPIRRILVPIDFSRFSEHALNFATSLAESFGAELHLLHVREDLSYVFPEPGMPAWGTGEFLAHQTEIATARLAELPSEPWRSTVNTARHVCEGTASVEIIRYAAEQAMDLIVMGTHGRRGLNHVLMGSVAEHVVRNAPCPVLTVRAPNTAAAEAERNVTGETAADTGGQRDQKTS